MNPYYMENHKAVGLLRNSGMSPYCMENHKAVGFLRNSGITPTGKSQSSMFP